MPPRVAALIVAAGRGTRAGDGPPKQYRMLAGRSVLARTLAAFADHPAVTSVQTVIGAQDTELYRSAVPGDLAASAPVTGGATRQDSVLAGLEALAASDTPPDVVLVHDAARPFVSPALIDRVIAPLIESQYAVVPALPVTDTVKRADPGTNVILETVDRTPLRRVQTPQGFRFADLLAAHRAQRGQELTDDAAVMEAAGHPVALVTGDPENVKLTTVQDFETAGRRLAVTRTGMGFDVHRFEPGDHVTLCGVDIPHSARLAGHSDADVGLHALTDAVLGAIAEGDIGAHFPPTDPQWKGASSDRFLAHAARLVRDGGGEVLHVDVTLICERPKVGPHREAMRRRVADILGLDMSRVSIKATTTEQLGFTGRREGIAAQAVATVCL